MLFQSIPFSFTTSKSFRHGFQGQEEDDEIKGEGNSVNFEYRMHDPRLGRFFAIDPLTKKYPFYSPYAFSGNRVIDCFELEGLEPWNYRSDKTGIVWESEEYRGESWTANFQPSNGPMEVITFTLTLDPPTEFTIIDDVESIQTSPNQTYIGPLSPTNMDMPPAVEGDLQGPGLGNIMEGLETFSKYEKTTLGTNGKYYTSGWGGNGSVKTSKAFNSKALKSLGKNAPIIGIVLDAGEVVDGFRQDGNTIGKHTIKETSGVAGGALGGWGGAWAGAAIGTAICPGPGTIIGGIIGGIFGSWGGEAAAEKITEEVQEEIYDGNTIKM